MERELYSEGSQLAQEIESHKLATAMSDREYRVLVRRYDQLVITIEVPCLTI